METSLTVKTERLDDVPLLLAHLERMGVSALLDKHFPSHSNWEGLSVGTIVCVWLSHILSESDHCLDHVRPWVSEKLESLQCLVSPRLKELDFTDDRLGSILTRLSAEASWSAFEAELSAHLLQVYDLKSVCVRHDSTTSSSFRSIDSPSDQGENLFQYAHSKDHRPDLPQLKVMLASLDPLGMPLGTEVLPGHYADDPLYIPSIERVQQTLEKRGLLHVGDAKLSALESRAFILASGDAYLCPLSKKQFSQERLAPVLQAAFESQETLREVSRLNAKGETLAIAEGFEHTQRLTAEANGGELCWEERLFIVRSFQYAQAAQRGLDHRLEKAQSEIEALNSRGRGKQRPKNREALQQRIEAIIKHYKVGSLLAVDIQEIQKQQRLRRYKDRPDCVRSHWDFQLQARRLEAPYQQTLRELGWRIYATPLSEKQMTLEDAVLCYRNEFRIEHNFKRIKGALSLRPFHLTREDRIQGLVHLLTIALRVLTLIEFSVRRQVQKQKIEIQGLYPGKPKRATATPTTEKLLEAFGNIQLSIVTLPQQTLYHLNPLSPLQRTILELMQLPLNTYDKIVDNSFKPP